MDNSENKPMRPIIAEDFDGPPGFYFAVCPSCKIMIDYCENPCSYCRQRIIWDKKKAGP